MKKFKLLILLVFLVLTSCVNVKDVRYLQPNENLVLNSEGLRFLMIICLSTE